MHIHTSIYTHIFHSMWTPQTSTRYVLEASSHHLMSSLDLVLRIMIHLGLNVVFRIIIHQLVRAATDESQETRNKKQNGLAHSRFIVCVTPKQKKTLLDSRIKF